LARTGFFVSMSITIAVKVLIRLRISAPLSTAARAISLISVTFGVSLTISSLSLTTFFTSPVICRTRAGSVPKVMPPFLTLGQLIFSSRPASRLHCASFSATATYSSMVWPAIFTKNGVLYRSIKGTFSCTNFSTPILASPMALSIPESVSTIRGTSLPSRGLRVILLVMKPPS